ncbi:MAG TPA: hypothetical protein VII47_14620 [Actinomycetota bacterium]|jgi:hypothetical protein
MAIKIGTKVVAVAEIRGGYLGRKVEAGTVGVVRGQRHERDHRVTVEHETGDEGDKLVFTVEWKTGTTTEAADEEITKLGFRKRFF